jgi:metallo-beta-lactamase family protein
VIIVGTKQKGLGKKILEGAKEVKIYGKYYPVEAKILKEDCQHMQSKRAAQWLSN